MNRSPITTHILDTSTGTPAVSVPVTLYKRVNNDWILLAKGMTDEDGRITDWLDTNSTVEHATYKLHFELEDYFSQQSAKQPEDAFYPFTDICFRLKDDKHHHIPLLLSPFGYSTYRGS